MQTKEPLKTYAEMRKAAEDAMTPKPDMDKVEHIDWLRKT